MLNCPVHFDGEEIPNSHLFFQSLCKPYFISGQVGWFLQKPIKRFCDMKGTAQLGLWRHQSSGQNQKAFIEVLKKLLSASRPRHSFNYKHNNRIQ